MGRRRHSHHKGRQADSHQADSDYRKADSDYLPDSRPDSRRADYRDSDSRRAHSRSRKRSRKAKTKSSKSSKLVCTCICMSLLFVLISMVSGAFIYMTIRHDRAIGELQTSSSRISNNGTNQTKVDLLLSTMGQNSVDPAESCSQIWTLRPSSPSGYYWIRYPNRSIVRVCCGFSTHECGCVRQEHLNPGLTRYNPAMSCKHLAPCSLPDGYYWIHIQGSIMRMYCINNATSVKPVRGWTRIGYINMNNPDHQCPRGLTLLTRREEPRRLCDMTAIRCISFSYHTYGIAYKHIYGRIIAYQYGDLPAFYYNISSIDGPYVYGISLTRGDTNLGDSRQHIWTFAGARDETVDNRRWKCPCINTNFSPPPPVPSFIGNDYFCDTGISRYSLNELVPDNPLWDGAGCGPTNTCCSFNNPPWFVKHLPFLSKDDIEVRMCRPNFDGSTPFQIIEIYVY